MKPQEIHVGRIYHDGKVGLREVFNIGGLFVSYRLLAGKLTRQQRLHGVDRTITLAAFAVWAKVEISPVEAHVLLNLQAAKIKLTPEESMYIDCLLSDPTHLPYTDGRYVLYGQNHGCALAGLEKKGLLLRLRDGRTAEILALGASLLNALGAKAVRKAPMSNEQLTAPFIAEHQRVSPFVFNGSTIVGVATSGGIFGNCHFQLCGKVWGDGSYSAKELIAAGANAEEIALLYMRETGSALS